MSECEIVGCYHNAVSNLVGLCKEHEVDLSYFQANVESETGRTPA